MVVVARPYQIPLSEWNLERDFDRDAILTVGARTRFRHQPRKSQIRVPRKIGFPKCNFLKNFYGQIEFPIYQRKPPGAAGSPQSGHSAFPKQLKYHYYRTAVLVPRYVRNAILQAT